MTWEELLEKLKKYKSEQLKETAYVLNEGVYYTIKVSMVKSMLSGSHILITTTGEQL